MLIETLRGLDEQIPRLDHEIGKLARENEAARRLMAIPRVGPVTAVAPAALAPPAKILKRGRDFAAWVGLTPLRRSTGGKPKTLSTRRHGNNIAARLIPFRLRAWQQ
ncbi:transposase [Microvirga guangxiensis]|uniref:Transposase IS116/IS110/IS902 family protein n=1 Tax=Microvirga guangxiensis TaxID=549386 RepID=A0A1G5KZC5_9HYPH|nr:transposase [Microvirga guangxiensis]SCZ05972.1 Transposase IS116/IS110/IS902 family protein [Microvirga guangxiensis]